MTPTLQLHLQSLPFLTFFSLNDFLTMEAAYEICPGLDAY